jgi:hypothetical protein
MRSDAGPGRITASDGYTGWSNCFIDLAPQINNARSLTRTLPGGNTGDSSPYKENKKNSSV